MGLLDHYDGPRPKEDKTGVTSKGCVFARGNLYGNKTFAENFDKVRFKEGGCQKASCGYFDTPECWELGEGRGKDFKECPLY
jgi:hypothetical protein